MASSRDFRILCNMGRAYEEGRVFRVEKLPSDAELRIRLENLGIEAGQEIAIRAVAPLGDPVVVRSRGADYSFRRETLDKIDFAEID